MSSISRVASGLKTAFIDVPKDAITSAASYAFGPSTIPNNETINRVAAYANVATSIGAVAFIPGAPLIVGGGRAVLAFVDGMLASNEGPAAESGLLRSCTRNLITAAATGVATLVAAHFGWPLELGALAALPATAVDLRDLALSYAPAEQAQAKS